MTKAELQKKIAKLETLNDFMSSELFQMDDMMRKIGFSNGLQTVKSTANEIISKNIKDINDL